MAKCIELTKGKVAIVDDEDYYWVSQWNWFATEISGIWYARRSKKKGVLRNCESFEVYLHRVVTRTTNKKLVVDHLDTNGLNNQKSNLRVCTLAENNNHTSSHKDSTSKYLGVSYDSTRHKWKVSLRYQGKTILNKRFDTEIEAARAYNIAAKKYIGNNINFNKV